MTAIALPFPSQFQCDHRQFQASSFLFVRLPDSLHQAGEANVVRLELIPTPANDEDHEHVEPIEQSTGFGHAPFGEVIGDGTPANCTLSTFMLDFGCLKADVWGSIRRGRA